MMRKCYNNKCGKIIKTKTDAVYVFCCVKCAEDSGFKNLNKKHR